MHVDRIPNRTSSPAFLLRETYREDGKVKKRTLANITHWPDGKIEALRRLLRDEYAPHEPRADLKLMRSLPHGHVAAALGMLRKLGLDDLLAQDQRQGARTVALGKVDEQELYDALDWLLAQQERIEAALARRHLSHGTLVLYDVSSTYFEGRTCELAKFGHNRDGKSGKLQIVFGLLCAKDGCPVAIEVFDGNVADPATLANQVKKLKERFALERVVLVGDRGMITEARIEEVLKPAGLDWITTLRAPAIRSLAEAGSLQLSLFDERDLATITSLDYPGERLVACRNPLLADERARKREDLLVATEKKLAAIAARVHRAKKPLRGKDKIALAIGRVVDKYKMAKHFDLNITDDRFTFARNTTKISAEAALDGVYVVRTTVTEAVLDQTATVTAYKQLSTAERAFRSLKTVDLEVRPIYHRRADRVRAHVFLCMLACYVEWHMRQKLKSILFDDHDKAAADAARPSIVAKAERSAAAQRKARNRCTDDGLPVHSLRSLLADLATVTRNVMAMDGAPEASFVLYPQLTPVQDRAFQLLDLGVKV